MKRLTKTEIINETVKYYSEDVSRRAVEDGACLYRTEDGRKCAVGRCLKRGAIFDEMGGAKHYDKIHGLDGNLKDVYRGHSLNFWNDLQNFHDFEGFWDKNGLTEHGKERLNILLERYKDN